VGGPTAKRQATQSPAGASGGISAPQERQVRFSAISISPGYRLHRSRDELEKQGVAPVENKRARMDNSENFTPIGRPPNGFRAVSTHEDFAE
jgi:hypothetical protein